MNRDLVTVVLVAAAITDVAAQGKKTPDISTVASAGAIADGKYTNSFFRLAVAAPNARLDLNPLVNKEGGGARLVQVMAKQTAFDNTYTFDDLTASGRSHNPKVGGSNPPPATKEIMSLRGI
jgi:hypothetical protein